MVEERVCCQFSRVMVVTMRSLIGLWLVIGWGELRADEFRASLLARYEAAFSPQRYWEHSGEQEISKLLHDTESYLRTNGVTPDDDLQLHQLLKKLSSYRRFLSDNHQRGMFSGWNYYRLIFNAIRDVDYRNITVSEDEIRSYYRLLYDGARSHVWHAIRNYQEHFPFLDWPFCQEIADSCAHQQPANRWSKIEQLADTMNSAIDRLNSKIMMLNTLMRSGSRLDRQSAVRDYLQSYSEIVAQPYGILLFLVAEKQHLSIVSAPRLPLISYKLKEFSYVDHQLLEQMFQELQMMFASRLSKIDALYDKNNKEPLIVFLIKHHQRAVAEFTVNYPQFSAVIDHYIELVNDRYLLSSSATDQRKNVGGAAIISSVGATYLMSLLLSRESWRAFTAPKFNVLAKISLALGIVATYYMTCNPSLRSFCERPALVESPRLRRQLQEMSWSLAMRQSSNLRYFLQELGRLEKLKDSATYQKLSIVFYTSLLAVRGVTIFKIKNSRLRKFFQLFRSSKKPPEYTLPQNYRQEFNLQEITAKMADNPDPEALDLKKRGEVIEELFRKYLPEKFTKDFSWKDITPEQANELSRAGDKLEKIFSPTNEDNVRKLYEVIGTKEPIAIADIRQDLVKQLKKIKNYIQRLFNIKLYENTIVSF